MPPYIINTEPVPVINLDTSTPTLNEVLQPYLYQVNTESTLASIRQSINNYLLAVNNIPTGNGTIPNETTSSTTYDYSNSLYTTNNLNYDFFGPTVEIGLNDTILNISGNFPDYIAHCDDKIYTVLGVLSPRERARQTLRRKITPVVKTRSEVLSNITPEERIALEALREMVTEDDFKKYLRYGFVLVRGRSGATYQIYHSRPHVMVWVGGKKVEQICIHFQSSCIPKTDKIIAFKTMIETDEESFKALGNRYRMAA